jgi:hypothetical protein
VRGASEKRLSDQRRQAVRGVLPATFVSAALIAHLVAAKAARDALFLTCFDVALLPRMLMSGAAVSLAAAFVAAVVMNRKSPAGLLVGALVTSAVLYGVECALLARFASAVAVMLYLHVAAFGATLVAALWSLVNEWFDPRTAKREVRRIALGGSLGGVLGGIMSWVVSGTHGLTVLLSMLGGLNLLALCAVLPLTGQRSRHTKTRSSPAARVSSVKTLRESPYLLALAALVALSAFSSALLEYVLGAQAVRHFPETANLTAFYASFHAGVGVLGLLVQFTLTRPILDRFGLAGSVALLPCAVLGSGVLALLSPGLWSAALLRGSEAVVQASVFRSGYELFYTPLPPAQKRPTKMLIDVGVDRLGTMSGGGLAALLVPIAEGRVQTLLLVLAMGAATAALWCALRLHRGYVDALASRLRHGTLHIDPSRVFDATTQRTLAESVSLDRAQILAAIAQQRSEHPDRPSAPPNDREHELAPALLMTSSGAGFEAAPGYVGLHLDDEDAPHAREERRDLLLERAAILRSGDVARIRAELQNPLTPELVWCALPLLAHDQLARDVLPALREVAPRAVGAMADLLLDPSTSTVLRRRVPRVLENCPTPRAIRVLVDGLFDPELSVRHQCALALLRIAEQSPGVRLPRERVLDAIEDELSQDRSAPAARRRERDALDDRPEFGEHALHERAHRGVEYVMTLLALVLDREPLRLAYHGLYAGSAAIRGTALEYLDSVLPSRLKQGVLALLEATPEPPVGARRDTAALADELLRSREFVLPSALGGTRK